MAFPVRFVNCLLQAKFEGAGMEVLNFIVNTFAGAGGLVDVTQAVPGLKKYDEDLGQTFGMWGLGPGFFINWPILGPSSVRDSFGLAGDIFLDPLFYFSEFKYTVGIVGYRTVNDTSLVIGEYEDLKESALDPYVAYRNAYHQYRRSKVEE